LMPARATHFAMVRGNLWFIQPEGAVFCVKRLWNAFDALQNDIVAVPSTFSIFKTPLCHKCHKIYSGVMAEIASVSAVVYRRRKGQRNDENPTPSCSYEVQGG